MPTPKFASLDEVVVLLKVTISNVVISSLKVAPLNEVVSPLKVTQRNEVSAPLKVAPRKSAGSNSRREADALQLVEAQRKPGSIHGWIFWEPPGSLLSAVPLDF